MADELRLVNMSFVWEFIEVNIPDYRDHNLVKQALSMHEAISIGKTVVRKQNKEKYVQILVELFDVANELQNIRLRYSRIEMNLMERLLCQL